MTRSRLSCSTSAAIAFALTLVGSSCCGTPSNQASADEGQPAIIRYVSPLQVEQSPGPQIAGQQEFDPIPVPVQTIQHQPAPVKESRTAASANPISFKPLDAEQELALHEGILKFEQGKYSQALEALQPIDASHPVATRYRSLCYLELGELRSAIVELKSAETAETNANRQLDAAVDHFSNGNSSTAVAELQAHTRANPQDAYSQLVLGASLAEEGDFTGAHRALAMAQHDSRLAPYVQPIQNELRHLNEYDSGSMMSYNGCLCEEIAPAKRYNLAMIFGSQYDSNVGQSSNFTGLGAVADKDDYGMFAGMFGDYRLIQEADRNLGVITSVYSNWFFDQDQFDIQDYSGGIYANQLLTENLFAGVRYEFHANALGNNHFANEHRLVPSINLLEGDLGHTTWFYEFDSIDYGAPVLIRDLDPSGDIHAFGVTQALYTFDGLGRVFMGYRYENANTKGADFERQTNQANARVEVPLTEKIIGDLGIRYFWDNYDNPNNLDFALRARSDERSVLRSGMQMILSENVSARLDYTWTNSTSNTANLFGVQFFDYSRHQVSAQWIYDF